LSAGFEGQATDIEIQAREIINVKRRLEEILAEHTRQPRERVSKDMERDYFMTSDEARDMPRTCVTGRRMNSRAVD
jgi:ATP-dependent Clp protease, protease subunit